MILNKFIIEFQGIISEDKKQELKERLISLSSSVKVLCINIIGDDTLIMSEVVEICKVIQECLPDDTSVHFGINADENFEHGHRKIELTLSDSEEDLEKLKTQNQIINI